MAGNQENSVAAIGGKSITHKIAQLENLEKTFQEQKADEIKKLEEVDTKVNEVDVNQKSEDIDLRDKVTPKRFYNVTFDQSLSKLFTEVLDRETDSVVFRIPAGYSEEAYKTFTTNKSKEEK